MGLKDRGPITGNTLSHPNEQMPPHPLTYYENMLYVQCVISVV